MPKYKIVVDTGIPYDSDVRSDAELKKELQRLGKMYKKNSEGYPYFEVRVYDELDDEVTDEVFDRLKINEG